MTDFGERLARLESTRRGVDSAAHDPTVHAAEFYQARDASTAAWNAVRRVLRELPESAEYGAQNALLAVLRRSGPGSGGK